MLCVKKEKLRIAAVAVATAARDGGGGSSIG